MDNINSNHTTAAGNLNTQPCPSCGYCPTCGRPSYQYRYYPYAQSPWYYTTPVCGTDNIQQTTNLNV